MIASDHSRQYAAGHRECRYHVVPSSRVPPFGSAVSKNCPPFDTRNPWRCGGSMCEYGVHSSIGAGFEVTENFSSRGSSQTWMGSTNAPVENTQRRSAPTPLQDFRADGIGDAGSEHPFPGRRKLCEGNHLLPHMVRRGLDIDVERTT